MKSPELRQRKVQALPLEPLRPVVTFYTTQNTITSLIAAPLDIRTHMVFALFSGVMYLGSALRGVRWELVPKAALPCALFSPLSPMPFGQMSDPLLCAVCSSLLFLSVRLQSAALWSS